MSHPAGCLCGYTPLLLHTAVHPTLVTPCRVFVWVNTVVVAHCSTSHCWRPLHGRVSVWIYSGYTAWTCECVGTPLGTVHACMSVGTPLGTLHGRVSVWVHPEVHSAVVTPWYTPLLSHPLLLLGHIAMHSLRRICCYCVPWSMSVLVTAVSPTKMADRSRCHFGCGLGWNQGTMYSVGALIPLQKGQFWGNIFRPFVNFKGMVEILKLFR